MRPRPALVICTAVATVTVQVLAAQLSASAGDHQDPAEVQVLSGPSPFAGGCSGGSQDAKAITGAEIEPAITADPSDPRHLVATWQQDIGLPAARSDLIATSDDGGRTWQDAVTIPGLTVCSGGTADFASDPWLSIGGDGTVYFSGLAGSATADPPPVGIVASRSFDGGRTWLPPATVASEDPGNDTDSITADPVRPGQAYVVWATWDHSYQPPMTNAFRFSRTTDSGSTWSPPVTVHDPGPTAVDFAGHVLVLPSGDLLAVWANFDVVSGLGTLLASRSPDEGRTWQTAVQIAAQPVGMFTDPESGVELPQPGFPSAAIAPDGTVYVASEGSSSPTAGAVNVSSSRDGGRTWTSSRLPDVSAFAFEPAIAVDAHGTVGVLWYDLREDLPGDDALSTDVWFSRSSDHGGTWQQEHVAGSFDLRTAPNHRLGEYQGLSRLRQGFAAVFTMTAPQAQDGPSDVFVARLGTGRR